MFVAVAAAVGNLLQGWDNSVIAGKYHKFMFSVFINSFISATMFNFQKHKKGVMLIILLCYTKMLQGLFIISKRNLNWKVNQHLRG